MLLTNHLVRWLMAVLISTFLQTATGHDDIEQNFELSQSQCRDYACFQKYWQSLSAEWDAGVVDSFKSLGVSLVETTDSALTLIPVAFREQAEDELAKFYQTNWDDLPQIIKDWIKEHPYQTAFYVANGVVFFAPSAVSGPVLWLLGYTSVGPRAASFASLLQSKLGRVGAKSLFAYFQSAGMGGYGAASVSTGIRVLAGLSASIHRVWDSAVSGKQKSKDNKRS